MKKLLFPIAILVTLFSCSGNKYSVTGSFEDDSFDGKIAYLINYDTKDTIDSVTVTQKGFKFMGEIDQPLVTRLVIKGVGPKATFIVENGEIKVDTKNRNAIGTALNDSLVALSAKEDAIDDEAQNLYEQYQAGTVSESDAEAKGSAIVAKRNKLFKDTYNSNKDNALGYFAFLSYTFDFTPAQFDSIMADAPASLGKMKRVVTWIEGAKNKAKTAVGSKFTDFVITSEDGQETRLSDFAGKGEYTIVDFWASWCGPCIREGENLKEIYNEYNGKGINILGVAVWDEPENTRNAIKKHELPWQQILNAQSIPTNLYGITGVPHIMIIDPQGTIIARGIYGDDLKAKVKELMATKK